MNFGRWQDPLIINTIPMPLLISEARGGLGKGRMELALEGVFSADTAFLGTCHMLDAERARRWHENVALPDISPHPAVILPPCTQSALDEVRGRGVDPGPWPPPGSATSRPHFPVHRSRCCAACCARLPSQPSPTGTSDLWQPFLSLAGASAIMLPDLANGNPGCLVKFELQINNT